jgi:hypothetical protein
MSKNCKTVYCQRLLVQGQVPVDSGTAWARVGKQMAKAWENIEK